MLRSCPHRAGWRRGASRRVAFLLLSGLTFTIPPAAGAFAQAAPAGVPAAHDLFALHIEEAAQRFGIPEHWITVVLGAESAGDAGAVSSAGAMGLMQIMPATWAELRGRHHLGPDPFDVRDNIHAGAAYLREMFDRYGGVGAMLAAYNAGPARYDEYLATGRPLPAETRAYVAHLAPRLAAEPVLAAAEIAAAPPPDWRESPLFVAHSGGVIGAAPAPLPTSPEADYEPGATVSFPASDPLFVDRTGGLGQ